MQKVLVKGVKKLTEEEFKELISHSENILPPNRSELENNLGFYVKNMNELKSSNKGNMELNYLYQILTLMIQFRTVDKQKILSELNRFIKMTNFQVENEIFKILNIQNKTLEEKNKILNNNKDILKEIIVLQKSKFENNNLFREKLGDFISNLKS